MKSAAVCAAGTQQRARDKKKRVKRTGGDIGSSFEENAGGSTYRCGDGKAGECSPLSSRSGRSDSIRDHFFSQDICRQNLLELC